jgi:hypothetical protein
MKIIEAPATYGQTPVDLFLAGGISNCPDWQAEAISLLTGVSGTALNPRRSDVFTDEIAGEQIAWEFEALHLTKAIIFWFPEETLCPITLFELGVFTQRKDIPVFVGTHPGYLRKFDVVTQLGLARPEIHVVDSVEKLVAQYITSLES